MRRQLDLAAEDVIDGFVGDHRPSADADERNQAFRFPAAKR
jgi:hypothetical protein